MLPDVSLFDRPYYGNSARDWLLALGTVVALWLALALVRRAVIRRLERSASRTSTAVDDVALGAFRRTHAAFLFAVALRGAEHTMLVLPTRVDGAVHLFVELVALWQAASWGSGAIGLAVEAAARRRGAHDKASVTTLNVLGVIARLVLWLLLLLLALAAFDIDVTGLVTGLGIAGVAVALAVQSILGDLFASLSIALDKPFVLGDTITVDQFTGTVEDIGLKTTRLRALSGETLVFSNADLLKARIRNYRGQAERRVQFALNVAPDTLPERLERVPAIVRELLAAEPAVRVDRAHVSAITDSALVVEAVYFVTTGDYGVYMDVQQRFYLALLRRLAAEGIALVRPVPPVVVNGAPGPDETLPAAPTPPDARRA